MAGFHMRYSWRSSPTSVSAPWSPKTDWSAWVAGCFPVTKASRHTSTTMANSERCPLARGATPLNPRRARKNTRERAEARGATPLNPRRALRKSTPSILLVRRKECDHDRRPDDGQSRAVRSGILDRGARGLRRLSDEHLRSAKARLRPRRGVLPLGRRRAALLGPAFWSGGQCPRPCPSHGAICRNRPDCHSRACLELLRHAGPSRARCAVEQHDWLRRGAGLLHQLRNRGQRGRIQDHPDDGAQPDHLDRGLVPWTLNGRSRTHPQSEVPHTVRAAAGRGDLRTLRWRGSTGLRG